MYASAQIPLNAVQNVLTVPVQAVQPSGQGAGVVLVVNSNQKIERRQVTLGVQTANDVEINSGLNENDVVIFGEQGQYQPGEVVAPKIVTSSAAE
jgi:membrane fusion protein (multidrug efflux system)